MKWVLVIVTYTLFAIILSTCIIYIGTPTVGSFEGSYFEVNLTTELIPIPLRVTVNSYCVNLQQVPIVEDRIFRTGKIIYPYV